MRQRAATTYFVSCVTDFQRIPGVRAASFSSLGLFSGGNSVSGIEVEGYAPKAEN